jgi:hypothetical protein
MRRVRLAGVVAIIVLLAATPVLAAPTIGNEAFRRTWQRQDLPVVEQVSGRSWTWGPAPISDLLRETLVDSPEGTRAVQYFDKSRMEDNDPTADTNATWSVQRGPRRL